MAYALGFNSRTRSSPESPDTRFWWVRSCIQGLLPMGEFEGPTLMRLHRMIHKFIINMFVRIYNFFIRVFKN